MRVYARINKHSSNPLTDESNFLVSFIAVRCSVCVHLENKEVLRGTNKKNGFDRQGNILKFEPVRVCYCYYIIFYTYLFFSIPPFVRLFCFFFVIVCVCGFFLLLFIFITLCVYTYDHLSSYVRKLFNGYSSSLSTRFSNNTTVIRFSE
jgi:hypothetical protein